MNSAMNIILLCGAAAVSSACSTLTAPNVDQLVTAQESYYERLATTLKDQRQFLELSLTGAEASDSVIRSKTYLWERDLLKAAVLLKTPQDAEGATKLMLLKLSEIDLATQEQLLAIERIDRQRIDGILALYDEVIAAAEALAKNNKLIADYLGDDDATQLLQSLDVATIAYATVRVRDLTRDLDELTARSEAEFQKELEKNEASLEKAKETLIDGLSKLN